MLQNISISQTISNQTSSPPISTMSLGPTSTFRSYNNNIVWINHDTPEATLDSLSYVTPNYQWKAAKDLTQLGPPENHFITLSLTAEPPLDHPLTPQKAQIMKKLDPAIFNPISIIDIEKFSHHTTNHPNKALISYLINGLVSGFRLGYTGERKQSIMHNLTLLELSPRHCRPLFIMK